jgi:integrase
MGADARGRSVWRLRGSVDGVSFDTRFHGSKTEAGRELTKLRKAAAEGSLATDKTMTVADLLGRYIDHRVALGKVRRGETERVYRGWVSCAITSVIGSRKIGQVRPSDTQAVIDARASAGKSWRQPYAIGKGAFSWALRQGWIAVNPWEAVTLPDTRRPKLTVPEAADIGAILAMVNASYGGAIGTAATTGLRRSEVLGLRWGSVFLEGECGGRCTNERSCWLVGRPHLAVEVTMQRIDGRLDYLPPKSEHSNRAVPLDPETIGMLRRVKREQAERRLRLGEAWSDGDVVFDSGSGRPMDPDTMSDAFKRAAAAAGVVGVRLHDLRHAYATILIGKGVDPATVSRILGHATVGFTMSVYVSPNAAMADPVAGIVSGALGGAISNI